MGASETESEDSGRFVVGDVVHDRDDPTPNAAYVARTPDASAAEWTVDEGTTVAEDNPGYAPDAPVVVVVYGAEVQARLPSWDRRTPLTVRELEDARARYYAFPAPRLELVHHTSCSGSEASEHEGTATADGTKTVEMDALSERLCGADWEIRREDGIMVAERWDETYRVEPNGEITGEGDLRSPLENLVSNYTN